MRRPFTRVGTAVAVATVLAGAACGGSGGGSDNASPKAELVSSVQALGDADALTTTIHLDVTSARLQSLARSSHDSISSSAADAISSGSVVIAEKKGSGDQRSSSVRVVSDGASLFELRSVDKTVYLQGDLQKILQIAGQPDDYAGIQQQVAQMPDFVRAFVNGQWVSLDSGALNALSNQLGAQPQSSAAKSAEPKMLADLRDSIQRDVTVTKKGSDAAGDHLVLTGQVDALAKDVQQAITQNVPGGSALGDRLSMRQHTGRTVTVDAWVKDGALTKLSLDLSQFADKGAPTGGPLPLTVTFDRSAGDISAPSGATPIDLTQLGALFGGMGLGAGNGVA